jgi:hypothetical protein
VHIVGIVMWWLVHGSEGNMEDARLGSLGGMAGAPLGGMDGAPMGGLSGALSSRWHGPRDGRSLGSAEC